MNLRLKDLFSGGAPSLNNLHKWAGNPGVYAVVLVIVSIVIIFIALAMADYVSRWKLFFLTAAMAIIAIPAVTLIHSHYANKVEGEPIVGGYAAPPQAFMDPIDRQPAYYSPPPTIERQSEPSEREFGTLSELFA